MKPNLKKLFLWSSLGSVALGAAVALARSPKRVESPSLRIRKIPLEFQGLTLWTERFEVARDGAQLFAHDRYLLLPTLFRVWSVLDLVPQNSPGRSVSEGAAIYHLTQVRVLEADPVTSVKIEEQLLERFYGVVAVLDSSGRASASGCIARGGFLEIKKCYVGGTSNGVESGEIHRSSAPILNFQIDFIQPE